MLLVEHRVPVDPFRGDVVLDRDARPLLDRVARRDARVVGGAGRQDDDALQVAELLVGHPEALEAEPPVTQAVADRLGDGLGLLVDLLEHERLETALLGALDVPVELDELVLDGRAVDAAELDALRRDRDDVAVVREVDATRLGEEGGGVRGQERLAVTDADDERRLEARADEQVGMVGVDGHEREVALHLAERLAHGLDEVAVVVALDQMRDGLGVGLGGKGVALAFEPVLELAVVLDDAVEHDREAGVVAAGQRMRVRLRDGAVRRPARVSEAR